MNVLGVIFDSKLTWSNHVTHCINKAKRKLYGVRLLRTFFTPQDMRTLLDYYFYSTFITMQMCGSQLTLVYNLNKAYYLSLQTPLKVVLCMEIIRFHLMTFIKVMVSACPCKLQCTKDPSYFTKL